MTAEPVHKLFAEPQPGPTAESINSSYVEVARQIAAICSARIILMIAVITGAALWGFTIWDPQRDRLYAAVAFSLVFVLPQVFLSWKKG